jgi:hypothetical protein
MNFGKGNAAAFGVFGVDTSGEDRRLAVQAWMMQQQTRQLSTGVACDSNNRGLYCFVHDSNMVLMRDSIPAARR